EASPALVLPALVIPPVFYVLVGLVSVRPLSIRSVLGAAATMCGVHALLVMATGALFMIPDLLDYGAAVAFALWGSPAVTLLQLTAAPLVFARLRPLLSPLRAPRTEARAPLIQRRVEAPAVTGTPRLPVPADAPTPVTQTIAPSPAAPKPPIAPPAQLRPPSPPPVVSVPASTAPPPLTTVRPAAVSGVSSGQTIAPSSAPVAGRSTAQTSPAAVAQPLPK